MAAGGRRDPNEYVTIVGEVFFDSSVGKRGVRPCEGQPFPQTMKIECAREIRGYPVGTKVQLDVVPTDREGSRPFLYSSYKWPHKII